MLEFCPHRRSCETAKSDTSPVLRGGGCPLRVCCTTALLAYVKNALPFSLIR
jgi:hypothetical protein